MNWISRRADQSLVFGYCHKADSGMAEECCAVHIPDRRGCLAVSHWYPVSLLVCSKGDALLDWYPGIPSFHWLVYLSEAHWWVSLILSHVNLDVQIVWSKQNVVLDYRTWQKRKNGPEIVFLVKYKREWICSLHSVKCWWGKMSQSLHFLIQGCVITAFSWCTETLEKFLM